MEELECLIVKENIDTVDITETSWNGENQQGTVIQNIHATDPRRRVVLEVA